MNEPHDELDPLRSAWAELRAPEALLRDGGEDPQAQACVDWMRAAWEGLEPAPPLARPLAGRHRGRRRTLRRDVLRRVLPFAAAACALLVWQISTTRPPLTAIAVQDESTELALVSPERPVIRPTVGAGGAIETRSGNVRLILLPRSTTPETSPEKSR